MAACGCAGKGKEEGGEDHSGLQKVMAEVEKLEDDIAAITAKKEQVLHWNGSMGSADVKHTKRGTGSVAQKSKDSVVLL